MIGAGILTGNVLGFVRSAVTAYLLGTRALADSLAVAIGPVDTLNSVVINAMIFAFVPLLTSARGGERVALHRRAVRLFLWVFSGIAAVTFSCAPVLIHLLGPGLDPSVYPQAVNLLRIAACSTLAAGASALAAGLLYTERRFGPFAFYQAILNVFVIAGALLLWKRIGVYGFAVGYMAGAFAQLLVVAAFALQTRGRLLQEAPAKQNPMEPRSTYSFISSPSSLQLLAKPGSFLMYAGLLALNVIVTRAYATQAGPGMAAAFDYCLRAVNVVIAYLVSPASNALLPEMARMRNEGRLPAAFRLLHRTIAVVAGAAVLSCLFGLLVRRPVFALLFQRGSFTAQSTELVSAVFLGLSPSLVGWSLMEIASRSLFALNRRWLPVLGVAIAVCINVLVSAAMHSRAPETIGIGSSVGLAVGFLVLFGVFLTRGERRLGGISPGFSEPDIAG